MQPPFSVASLPLTLQRSETVVVVVGLDRCHYGGSRQKRLGGSCLCEQRWNYHICCKQERRPPPVTSTWLIKFRCRDGGLLGGGGALSHLQHNGLMSWVGTLNSVVFLVYVEQTPRHFERSIDDSKEYFVPLIGRLVGFVNILAVLLTTAVYGDTKSPSFHQFSVCHFTICSANTLQISIWRIYVSCKWCRLSAELPFPLSFSHAALANVHNKKKMEAEPAEHPEGHWQVFAGGWWSRCHLEPSASLWDSAGFLMGRVWWDCCVVSGGLWHHRQSVHPNPRSLHGLLGIN